MAAMLASRVVGDYYRTEAPERRDLLGIEPRRAIESGNENDGQAPAGTGSHGVSFVS
jgi:hypothetical protein